MERYRRDWMSAITAVICLATTAIWLRVLWQAISMLWSKS